MTSVNLEKASNVLKFKKACGLKISQNIVYVKEYFYMLLFTLQDII